MPYKSKSSARVLGCLFLRKPRGRPVVWGPNPYFDTPKLLPGGRAFRRCGLKGHSCDFPRPLRRGLDTNTWYNCLSLGAISTGSRTLNAQPRAARIIFAEPLGPGVRCAALARTFELIPPPPTQPSQTPVSLRSPQRSLGPEGIS